MRLSFIVTIDPIKDLALLDILIHSLNLQTINAFNVVFYNQTLLTEAQIFSRLSVTPRFSYHFFGIDRSDFLGDYPIWDLYAFHAMLLDRGLLNDYFMALHIEEFLDVDYVEHALNVLGQNRFDILFGNLTRTRLTHEPMAPILAASTADAFDRQLKRARLKRAPHFGFPQRPLLSARSWTRFRLTLAKLLALRLRTRFEPTPAGYTVLRRYFIEDVYFMKRTFAERYNWFLRGHHMYFEDIHICEQQGVCELSRELQRLTVFPVYFNRRRVYHLRHARRYYQLVDDTFTRLMLRRPTDDPILGALKEAIEMYRDGRMSVEDALTYSRQNHKETGTQNLNYRYHMLYLRDPDSGRQRDDGAATDVTRR